MSRTLFAPRNRRAPIRRPSVRLQLEQLEKREVLDAGLVQAFNYLTYNAYQTAQQTVQLQNTAQTHLTHFQQDAAAYAAGKGVTLAQLNQDLATLKQDGSGIEGLNSSFQNDVHLIILGAMANAGNFSTSDLGSLFVDAYFLRIGLSEVSSALQTANSAAAAAIPPAPSPPAPPPTPPPGPPNPIPVPAPKPWDLAPDPTAGSPSSTGTQSV